MPAVAEILAKFRADTSQFVSEVNNAVGVTDKMATQSSTLSKIGGAMFLALGAAAVGFVGEAVKSAEEYDSAHVRLVQSIKNVGEAYAQQSGKVENIDTKMRQLGFTDSDTETSLSRLIPVTKSTQGAIDLMGVAADVAAGRHLALTQVTQLLVRAETGHASVLGRLGVQMHDTTGQTITATAAIQQLGQQYAGQAAAQADTFGGKIKVVEANLDHFATTVGEAVIPIIEQLAQILGDVTTFFENNTAAAIALGSAIGLIALPPLLAFTAGKITAGIQLVGEGFQFVGSAASGAVEGVQNAFTAISTWVQGGNAAVDIAGKTESGVKKMASQFGLSAAAVEAMGGEAAPASAALEGVGASAAGAGAAAAAAEGGFVAFATSTAGITLGASLAIVALGGLAIALGLFDSSETEAAKKGDVLGRQLLDQASTMGNVIDQHKFLQKSIDDTNRALKVNSEETQANSNAITRAYTSGTTASQALIDTQRRLSASNQTLNHERDAAQAGLDQLSDAYKKAMADQEVAKTANENLSKQLGFHITITDLDTKTQQKFSVAIQDLAKQTNTFAVKVAEGAGLTAQGFIQVDKQVAQFSNTVASSLEAANDPFKNFSKNFDVGIGDFNKFLQDSLHQSQDWATKFHTLMAEGINQGWIDEIAKAGPAAGPLLDNLQKDIDTWGIGAVNDVKDKLIAINNDLTQAYAADALHTATVMAEQTGAVNAYLADLKTGGVKNLTDFANQGDDQMKRFAYIMLTQLLAARQSADANTHGIAGSMDNVKVHVGDATAKVTDLFNGIQKLPHDKPVNINVHTSEGELDNLERRLTILTRQPWFINVAIAGNAAGAATGAVQQAPKSPNWWEGSDRNSKKNIVPVPW